MQGLSRALQRHFGALLLVLLAAAALLDARAFSSLAAIELAPSAADLVLASKGVPANAPSPEGDSRVTSADSILRRNPFDSTTGSLLGGEIVGHDDATPLEMAACPGLRAEIIVASREPDWSMAVLASTSDPKPLLRRRGGTVGDREVVFVAHDRVWLRAKSGALCQARMFAPREPGTPAGAKDSVAVQGVVRGADKPLDPAIAGGIALVGPREYRIDRGVVDRIFGEYADLMKGTVIAPDKENGRTVGVRVMGIRQSSVLAALGIENGDRITTVNGYDVTDPEKALTAFGIVRSAPRITVELTRNGKPTSVVYDVR